MGAKRVFEIQEDHARKSGEMGDKHINTTWVRASVLAMLVFNLVLCLLPLGIVGVAFGFLGVVACKEAFHATSVLKRSHIKNFMIYCVVVLVAGLAVYLGQISTLGDFCKG